MKRALALSFSLGIAACNAPAPSTQLHATHASLVAGEPAPHLIEHVLLVSVDGLHAVDLERFKAAQPSSTLAKLSRHGYEYTDARTSRPSDSFPGLLNLVTGSSPASTGVYYDDSYDRRLSPPGSDCSTVGTEVVFDESIDVDNTRLDGGGGIDPTQLPRDPAQGCAPVYPHEYLRVNTIFEVVKAFGGRTAWSDKHLAYDLVNGPSGQGVDDLWSPEIAATDGTVAGTEAYDDLKVQALVNELGGFDHAGSTVQGVPSVLGMNFQAVSVAQKTAGYLDASGAPTPSVTDALTHTDQSLGRLVQAIEQNGLGATTLIVITAKHGQSPIDPAAKHLVSNKLIAQVVDGVQAGLAAQVTADDVALIWLTDQKRTADAVAALEARRSDLAIAQIYSGAEVVNLWDDPRGDSRTPDIAIQPVAGTIYTKLTATKVAEHGGFADDDTHVALLVAHPWLRPRTIRSTVSTAQVAPTVLEALGLDGWMLDGVRAEGTPSLPPQ